MSTKLSAADIEAYQRDGIFFPVRVMPTATAARLLPKLEQLTTDREKPEPIRQPHLRFRWAWDLALRPAVLDAVEDVLGPDLLVHSTIVFHKPGGSALYVSWHQDSLYRRLRAPKMTSAWIALTESQVDNGCMRVIPGSHRGGILHHVETPTPDNLLSHGQEVTGVDESQALDVVLKPGEMSLHHGDIVHGSNPNRSARERAGFIVRFATPEVERLSQPGIRARGCAACHHLELLESPPVGLE